MSSNSREAAHRSGALRGVVAPLGWVTEDRVICGLKSGKVLLPPKAKRSINCLYAVELLIGCTYGRNPK